jgi:membrane-bound lytic murein transglycosylase C
MNLVRLLASLTFLLLSGCETTDKTLSTAERMLRSTTGRTVIDLAQGKDPKQILKERAEVYQRNPDAAIRDLRAVQRDCETLMAALTGKHGARKKSRSRNGNVM